MAGTLFNEREHAFEAKFAHDAETDFLTRTRGGTMFVNWLAGLLHLSDEAAATHANNLIAALLAGHKDADILAAISSDLALQGHAVSHRLLSANLQECRAEARRALFAH